MAASAVGPLGSARRRALEGLRLLLGPRFVRHYIARPPAPRPPHVDARAQRRQLAGTLSDSMTIMKDFSPLRTRYHYNAVENSVLHYFIQHPLDRLPRVLDVGSGAGHWIDFYRDVLGAEEVTGLEIDSGVAQALQQKYAGDASVEVHCADVVDPLPVQGQFSVVNAIGVMFHIVDDRRWAAAVANLARALEPGGVLIVGGQFGPVTHDVGYRNRLDGVGIELSKRLRSRRRWRSVAADAGLEYDAYIRTRRARIFDLPEANLLVFRRP